MSEHLPEKHEKRGELDPDLFKEHQERIKDHHEARNKAETRGWLKRANELDEARKTIEKTAEEKERERQRKESERHENHQRPAHVSAELKDMAYRRTLKRVQKKLPAPARAFSKMVHNPIVDTVSDAVGKTVARPSGILSGGIAAFLASVLFLWVTKHYGYEYNYLLFAIFFAGGYFIGLVIELGLRIRITRRARSN